MVRVPFGELLQEPLRNGLTRPKRVRGSGVRMVNMGELFTYRRIGDVEMDRVPLNDKAPERDLLAPNDLLFARQSLVAEGAGQASIFLGASEPITYESHLIRARIDPEKADPHWLFYFFESSAGKALTQSIVNQVAAAGIRGSDLVRLPIPCPPLDRQRRWSGVLRTLDEKIESIGRVAGLTHGVLLTLFQLSCARESAVATPLSDVTAVLRRGIAPKYCDAEGVLVVNQRCIRDTRIDFALARRHDHAARTVSDDRFLQIGDIVVNSTGVGTLGRLAQVAWLQEPATVDSHVTIVRPDPTATDADFLAWELISRQPEIERLGHGSTGQTELNRARLGDFELHLPARPVQDKFGEVARRIREKTAALQRERLALVAVREALVSRLLRLHDEATMARADASEVAA